MLVSGQNAKSSRECESVRDVGSQQWAVTLHAMERLRCWCPASATSGGCSEASDHMCQVLSTRGNDGALTVQAILLVLFECYNKPFSSPRDNRPRQQFGRIGSLSASLIEQ